MNNNPYSPLEIQAPAPTLRKSAWRFLPAVCLLLIGSLSSVLATVLAVAAIAGRIPWDNQRPRLALVIGEIGTYLIFGMGLILAGVAFALGNIRLGTYTAIAAFAILALWIYA